jgi:uncharacterized protein (DUF427 family)
MIHQGHSVEIVPAAGRVRVWLEDVTLADTQAALIVRETGLPDRLYLPPEALRVALEPTATRSTCPYKGEARYWTLRAIRLLLEDVAWSYFQPTQRAERIRDYLSFYAHRVNVEHHP